MQPACGRRAFACMQEGRTWSGLSHFSTAAHLAPRGCCTGGGGARAAQGGRGAPGARRRQLHRVRGPLRGALAAGAPRRSAMAALAAGYAAVAGAHALSRQPRGSSARRCARASPVEVSPRLLVICRLQRVYLRRQEIQEYVARATEGASSSDPFEVGRRPCTLGSCASCACFLGWLQAGCAAKRVPRRLSVRCQEREVAC